jgi:hypothetical protein
MKTCAPATLAVVASSPRARNVNFIGEAFGSRRFNGRIRQQQRLRRRVVAELVRSDGKAPVADVLIAPSGERGLRGRDIFDKTATFPVAPR